LCKEVLEAKDYYKMPQFLIIMLNVDKAVKLKALKKAKYRKFGIQKSELESAS